LLVPEEKEFLFIDFFELVGSLFFPLAWTHFGVQAGCKCVQLFNLCIFNLVDLLNKMVGLKMLLAKQVELDVLDILFGLDQLIVGQQPHHKVNCKPFLDGRDVLVKTSTR